MTSKELDRTTTEPDQRELASLFCRNPHALIKGISRYYPLPQHLIEKHKETLDWYQLSLNGRITWTEDFIDRYEARFTWRNGLSKNPNLPWSVDLIIKYNKHWGTDGILSENTGLPWSHAFIDRFRKAWNYHWLVVNESISWTQEMIADFNVFSHNLMVVNGPGLWTMDFIREHRDKFNWQFLSYNPHLPFREGLLEEIVRQHKFEGGHPAYYSRGLSVNCGIGWNQKMVDTYLVKNPDAPLPFYWDELSLNPGLPWQEGNLFERFLNNWNWDKISQNEGINLTESQVEQYKDRLLWKIGQSSGSKTIAMNPSLPWSEEFLDKYDELWYWYQISLNPGIPWNEHLIEKYRNKLDFCQLCSKASLPWSWDFITKYEDQVFSCFNSPFEPFEEAWNIVFQPVLDDDIVDYLLSSVNNPNLLREFQKERHDSPTKSPTVGPVTRLVNDIMQIQDDPSGDDIQKTFVADVTDKIKLYTCRIAEIKENDQYHFELSKAFRADEITKERQESLITKLAPYCSCFIDYFKSVDVDPEYVVQVTGGHLYDAQVYMFFKEKGGHVSIDFTELENLRSQIGHKALQFGYLYYMILLLSGRLPEEKKSQNPFPMQP